MRNIMEHYRNYFWYFVSYITDTIRSASIFFCVMAVIDNFRLVLTFLKIFIEFFFAMYGHNFYNSDHHCALTYK